MFFDSADKSANRDVGAFNAVMQYKRATYATTSTSGDLILKLEFDANSSNSVYTNSGKVMPLSISKQSYIIYK